MAISLKRGVCFVVYGKDFHDLAMKTISYSRKYTKLPFAIFTNIEAHSFFSIDNTMVQVFKGDLQSKNREIKTLLSEFSPFEETLYIDCDSVIQNNGIEKVFDILDNCDAAFVEYGIWHDSKLALSYYRKTMSVLNVDYPLHIFYGAFFLFKKNNAVSDFFKKWNSNWLKVNIVREMPALACTLKNDKKLKYEVLKKDSNIFSWKKNKSAIVQHEYGDGESFWYRFFANCNDGVLVNG